MFFLLALFALNSRNYSLAPSPSLFLFLYIALFLLRMQRYKEEIIYLFLSFVALSTHTPHKRARVYVV